MTNKKVVRKNTSTKKSAKPVPKTASKNSKSPTTKRKYEGASRSKRLSRWQASSTSSNSEVNGGLVTLRNRSRDLRRNNPYAARAIQAIGSNVVGEGIMTRFMNTEETKSTKKSRLELMWDAWANSTDIDFDGQHDIYSLQLLIMEAVVESGEVLVRKRVDSSKVFPLQYQVLESDFLDLNAVAVSGSLNTVVQGIEFDKKGRRVAYFLYEQHPGGYDHGMFTPLKSNRVPAEDIMHIFRMDRPGQARGVPWLSPVIVRLKDFDDFEDAQLVRQKIAACFTAFVHDLSADTMNEDEPETDLGDRVEPAMIEHLPPGKTITFANPPGVQNYKEYTSTVLHGIAVGVGITYECLTNDYSMVNYSSGRMGWLEMFRNVKVWRQNIVQLKFLEPLVKDFKKTAQIMGIDVKNFVHTHIPPKREMIDPTKEIPAAILAIQGGISTLSDEIMAQGKDVSEHLQQYKQDMDALDALGIKIDSDPRVAIEMKKSPVANGGTEE